MAPERHVTITTDEPTTLHEALAWILEQFDTGGPLHDCEMPKIQLEQIMVADSTPDDEPLKWRPEWRGSVTGHFEQVGTKAKS